MRRRMSGRGWWMVIMTVTPAEARPDRMSTTLEALLLSKPTAARMSMMTTIKQLKQGFSQQVSGCVRCKSAPSRQACSEHHGCSGSSARMLESHNTIAVIHLFIELVSSPKVKVRYTSEQLGI